MSANAKKTWQKSNQKSALAMAKWLFGPAAGTSCQVTGVELKKETSSTGIEKEQERELPEVGSTDEEPVPEQFVECLYEEEAEGEGQMKDQEHGDLQGFRGHPIPKGKVPEGDEMVVKAVMTLV